jgi:hypothetical protein
MGAGDNRKVGEVKRAKLQSSKLHCFALNQKQFGSPPLAFISMGARDNIKEGKAKQAKLRSSKLQ